MEVCKCLSLMFLSCAFLVAAFEHGSFTYTWDDAWPRDNASWVNATYRPTAIAVEPAQNGKSIAIHMTARGNLDHPITTFDADGNVIRRWGHPDIVKSHGLKLEMNGGRSFLWVTDMGDYAVKQFDAATGKLEKVIGMRGVPGTGISPLQFGNVSDVAFSEDGSTMFIADGDCLCVEGGANHRVIALDAKTFAVKWTVGNDGTFQNPHALDYDVKRSLVWVADREHNRTVALDARTGKIKGSWSVERLEPVSHPPSINGLRVDSDRDCLVLGLLPAPIHSAGGVFQLAVFNIEEMIKSPNKLPSPLYQRPIPVRGLHELAIDKRNGDLYLALFEVGQVAHVFRLPQHQVAAERRRLPKDSVALDSAGCDSIEQPPTIISHHIHVLFHGADRSSMAAALAKRSMFLHYMGLNYNDTCPMAHSDPAPTFMGICAFPFEFDPDAFPVNAGGPFEAPNFSFFASDALLQKAITWWQSHRQYVGGALDVLVHANSGCQENDHTKFGMWMGTPWEMNIMGLACCRHGPAGCFCYDTYYISRAHHQNATRDKCLAVDGKNVIYNSCDLSEFQPTLMWHEVTYQQDYHAIDSLGYGFGSLSGDDNCIGASSCEIGANLSMSTCGENDKFRTRFRFVQSASSNYGVMKSESCEGLCVLVDPITWKTELGECTDPRAIVERRCVMAPGQAPVTCPEKQMLLAEKMSDQGSLHEYVV